MAAKAPTKTASSTTAGTSTKDNLPSHCSRNNRLGSVMQHESVSGMFQHHTTVSMYAGGQLVRYLHSNMCKILLCAARTNRVKSAHNKTYLSRAQIKQALRSAASSRELLPTRQCHTDQSRFRTIYLTSHFSPSQKSVSPGSGTSCIFADSSTKSPKTVSLFYKQSQLGYWVSSMRGSGVAIIIVSMRGPA